MDGVHQGVVVALLNTPLKLNPALSPLKTGVYMIRNRVNGKCYVGSAAVNLARRFALHRYDLRHNCHHSQRLQRAWNKYGESSFEFVILCKCSPEWCLCMEQIFIQIFGSSNRNSGYNILPSAGSSLGHIATAEHKRKIADGVSKSWTHERRAELSLRLRGKKRPREVVEKSIATFRLKMTDERRQEYRNRFLGISTEKKEKIIASSKTPEAKEKHRVAVQKVAQKRTKEEWRKITEPRWAGDARIKMSIKMKGVKKPDGHGALIIAGRKRAADLKEKQCLL